MRKLFFYSLIIAILLFVSFSATVSAQTKQRVRFAKSATSATVKGTIRGYDFVDYIVGARGGQEINVRLSAPATVPVFTVFLPNGDNLEEAAERDEFSGTLPETGDYVVRVGMMRAAARRKKSTAAFTLKISIQ